MTGDVDLDGDQLIARRYLDAEPALVWEVFTTPEHLAAFWGGHHATVPPDSVVVDLRVGGTFALETEGADGGRRPLRFRYEVVEPPARLVLAEARTGITTEIRLRPSGRGTTLLVHQRRLPPELRSAQARTGLAGILDRLDTVLHELTSATDRERQ
ncbi:SRPBCC family protein [Plantactinospora sp. WMMB334]|uniref:SRPBCC family protein n=1 Tax=Plantactinospora sp. WMMB334 TaxID=3404119 RepID=UPI003B939EA8